MGEAPAHLRAAADLYELSRVCYIATMRYGWVALYLGLDVAFIVSLAAFGDESAGRAGLGLLVAATLVHPLLGFAIGSYWALLLPFVPALMALPAGTPDGGEWSLSASLTLVAVFQSVLLVPGVVARQVRDAPPCDEGRYESG
jgi:hypothetical protein